METDALMVGDRFPLWCFEPGQKTDQGSVKAPPSVAVRQGNLLEGHFELRVVNAQHRKTVPGRKTDVRDAEWIADLFQHGLLKGSSIPPPWQRELRELTRSRVSLVQDRLRAVNRLQKTREDTHLKVGDVATSIMGKSARAMLEALLAGQTDPVALADLAQAEMEGQTCSVGRSAGRNRQAPSQLHVE